MQGASTDAVLVADLHLRGGGDEASFLRWLDALDAPLLVLLGDVFHQWWEFPGGRVAGRHAAILDALAALGRRGTRVVAVRGNHDFALGRAFSAWTGGEARDAHERVLGGLRCLLAHGDEADRTLRYRVLRAGIRSAAFRAGIAALGPRLGDALLGRLAGDPVPGGRPAPGVDAAQRAWAARHLARNGLDAVIAGHLHRSGIHRLEGGLYVRVPDWGSGPAWAEVAGRTVRLVRQGRSGRELLAEASA